MSCPSSMFQCIHTKQCIFRRYLCDGKADCPDLSDETFERCGKNSCKDRIYCMDGRCIPNTLCCDPLTDSSCDKWKQMRCCTRQSKGQLNNNRFTLEPNKAANNLDPNWGFHSAVMVITGSSLAFLLILLIASVVLIRFLLTKLSVSRRRQLENNMEGQSCQIQSNNVTSSSEESTDARLLVQYNNINNGIQVFAPFTNEPPPYSDDVPPPPYSTLPRYGQPPPYDL